MPFSPSNKRKMSIIDNDDDDVLVEIRMKYAEDLEEILECPICLELPKDLPIPTCETGHHLCNSCMKKVGAKCPICECRFGSGRNYAVEKICAKFEDIKNSILDPKHASNRRVKKDRVSVAVQTEIINNEKTRIKKKQKNSDSDSVDDYDSSEEDMKSTKKKDESSKTLHNNINGEK